MTPLGSLQTGVDPSHRVHHVPVLIVGAGPAGLVAGITLTRYGVHTLVVEKRFELSTLAKAQVISTRTMEILRAWGLEDAVRAGDRKSVV